MICKLVTWGNDRSEAMDRMRDALDCYKIRGLDHNINFLRAILDHPRFIRGELSTKFIPEEYPDGFQKTLPTGRVRTNLVVSSAVLQYMRALKCESVNEQLSSFKPTEEVELRVQICADDQVDQVVSVHVNTDEFDPLGYDDLNFDVTVTENESEGPKKYAVNWNQMDNTVYNAQIGTSEKDTQDIFLHLLRPTSTGFKVMYHGFEYEVKVLTPRQHELSKHMIPKVKPDMSKYVLSPMPGSVIDVLVKDGQTVEIGQNLFILEAMKMQNVIKSDKNGVIKSVAVKKGANVENDAVLIEWQ
jgi:propionyl-CoA carboxylase alpha chain